MSKDVTSRNDLLDITQDIIETDEYGLYSGGWTKKELTPESFSHPAKASRKLARWIYDHAIAEGWLKPGDVVIDPFGGIGGFALDGMAEGAIVVLAELERHFVDMAAGCDCTGITTEDFEAFRGHYEKRFKMPQREPQTRFNKLHMEWEYAKDDAFTFDTTEMAEWLCEYEDVDETFDAVVEYDEWVPGNFDVHRYEDDRHWCPACIARAKKEERNIQSRDETGQIDMFSLLTPKYFTDPHHYEGNVERWKRWGLPGRAICLQGDSRELVKVLGQVDWAERGIQSGSLAVLEEYGDAPGQLSQMPEGSLVAGSPPYSESLHGKTLTIDERRIQRMQEAGYEARSSHGFLRGKHSTTIAANYSDSSSNLGNLPEGDISAAISSPAFGTAETRDRSPVQDGSVADAMTRSYTQSKQGESEGNLAAMEMGDLACGSPPYASAINPHGEGPGAAGNEAQRQRIENGVISESAAQSRHLGYSLNPENLGNMPPGDLVVSSSPFQGTLESKDTKFQASARPGRTIQCADYGQSEGQLGAMSVGSPPYINSINASPSANDAEARIERKQQAGIDITQSRNVGGPNSVVRAPQVYGASEGQLGAMSEGQIGNLTVSSPPFQSSDNRGAVDDTTSGLAADGSKRGGAINRADYGRSEGQLGKMVASSPPYEGSISSQQGHGLDLSKSPCAHDRTTHQNVSLEGLGGAYSDFDDNLGNSEGNTFWSAARLILLQLHQVLKPNAHAIFVTKRFVRSKAIVNFSLQWAQLCESCGFKLIHWHRCWMIEESEGQLDFEGKVRTEIVKRFSFFRRLHAQKYPHLAIEWEDVTCYVRV